MDLVVIGEWDTLPLHSLAQALLKNSVCNENIQVLDKASVSYYLFYLVNIVILLPLVINTIDHSLQFKIWCPDLLAILAYNTRIASKLAHNIFYCTERSVVFIINVITDITNIWLVSKVFKRIFIFPCFFLRFQSSK